MDAFHGALRTMRDDPRRCPHCHAADIPGAKPTLEREPDGSLTCTMCSYHWIPQKEKS